MARVELAAAVEQFAAAAQAAGDLQMSLEWAWQDYKEGLRFTYLRTAEELRQLAADLTAARQRGGALTTAHRLLGNYHSAYRDLQAAFLGVDDALASRDPLEGEWTLKQTLAHIIDANTGFYFVLLYALGGSRQDEARPDRVPVSLDDEGWMSFWEEDDLGLLADDLSLPEMQAYYHSLHRRILDEFAGITEDELQLASEYWEKVHFPVEFRLIRFESHLRQHTIQAEKVLDALRGAPTEARRLLRWVYAGLADAENAMIGVPGYGAEACQVVCEILAERTAQVSAILAGG